MLNIPPLLVIRLLQPLRCAADPNQPEPYEVT
jgi:hypothetical protein